jgi:hypothetical protein
MVCRSIVIDGKYHGVAYSRGERAKKCRACSGRAATRQCDFPLKGRKAGKTCDMNICDDCAVVQVGQTLGGDSVDYCPVHDRMSRSAAQTVLPT